MAAEKKRRIAWFPVPGKCEDFLRRYGDISNEKDMIGLLVEGHKSGAIVILGFTDKNPGDFEACLQEFGSFRVYVDNRNFKDGEANG